jgi:hypothetical protein
MFDEKSIAPGLAELGYLRLKKLTYKASWGSTDVEHFLFFSLYGGGDYFSCYFGMRNPDAERFARLMLALRAIYLGETPTGGGVHTLSSPSSSRINCHPIHCVGYSSHFALRAGVPVTRGGLQRIP